MHLWSLTEKKILNEENVLETISTVTVLLSNVLTVLI